MDKLLVGPWFSPRKAVVVEQEAEEEKESTYLPAPSSPSYNPIIELEHHLLSKQEEVLRLRTDVDILNSQLSTTEAQLKRQEDREEESKGKNDQFIITEQENKQLKGELADEKRKLQKLDESRSALIRDKEHIKLERDLERDLNRSLTNDLEVARRVHADLQCSLEREQERTQRQLMHLEQLNSTLKQGLDEAQHENIELKSIRARIEHLELRNISLQQDLESTTIEKHGDARLSSERTITLEDSMRSLQQRLSEEEIENRELMVKLTEMNRENEELYNGMQQLEGGVVQDLQLRLREMEESQTKMMSAKNELETANERLQDQWTVLAQEMDEYKEYAETTIKSSNADLNGKETSLAELQMLHKNDTASIVALNKQVADQTDMLASLAQQFTACKDDSEFAVQKSRTALATLETAIALAKKSNNELERVNQQLMEDVINITKELQCLKQSTEDRTSAHKATLDKMMSELATISTTNTNLETANARLKDQLTVLAQEMDEYKEYAETTIKSSNADLSGKETSLVELQMLHKNDTASIVALNKQVAEQTNSISALVTANAVSEEQLTAMEAANALSQEQLAAMETANALSQEQLAAMETANALSQEQLAAMETANTLSQEQLAAMETANALSQEQLAALSEEFAVYKESSQQAMEDASDGNKDKKLIRELEMAAQDKQREYCQQIAQLREEFEDLVQGYTSNHDDKIHALEEKLREKQQELDSIVIVAATNAAEAGVISNTSMMAAAVGNRADTQVEVIKSVCNSHDSGTQTVNILIEGEKLSHVAPATISTMTMTTPATVTTVSSQTVDIMSEEDKEKDKQEDKEKDKEEDKEGDEGEDEGEDTKQPTDGLAVIRQGDKAEEISPLMRPNDQSQQQQEQQQQSQQQQPQSQQRQQEETTRLQLQLDQQTQDYCQKLTIMREELTSLRDELASAISAKQTAEKQMHHMQEQMQQMQNLFRQYENDMIHAKVSNNIPFNTFYHYNLISFYQWFLYQCRLLMHLVNPP